MHGRLDGSSVSVSTLPLCMKTPRIHRIYNLRGIFAAADAIAAVKLGDAPLYLGVENFRDDVAGIIFADASLQKRRARASGADIGGVGALCVSELPSVSPGRHILHGIFADDDAIARCKVGDTPLY